MKALATVMLIALAITARADDSVKGDPSPGSFWLTRVELRGNELVLTRSSEDLGFSFQRDGGSPPVASPAHSVWKLPTHLGATFFGHESTFVLIPATGHDHSRTLFVTEETNRRCGVHAGLLLRSPSPNGRMVVDGVVYMGLLPCAMKVTSQESLAAIVTQLTQ